jgi:hypothetical protein
VSPDARATTTARRRRTILAVAATVTLAALAACGAVASMPAAAPDPVPADDTTAQIAAVEAAWQCVVVGRSYPAASDITADLEGRLSDAGLTYEQWRGWRDALATSPALVEQYAALERNACPGA